MVETTKVFATHVGVIISPNVSTQKYGQQTLGKIETCKFVTHMWRRQQRFCVFIQFKTKIAAALCHFHFFAYLQKIQQIDLTLTFDKIILSV